MQVVAYQPLVFACFACFVVHLLFPGWILRSQSGATELRPAVTPDSERGSQSRTGEEDWRLHSPMARQNPARRGRRAPELLPWSVRWPPRTSSAKKVAGRSRICHRVSAAATFLPFLFVAASDTTWPHFRGSFSLTNGLSRLIPNNLSCNERGSWHPLSEAAGSWRRHAPR